MNKALVIGLVSISDRASGGVYEDKGIPALHDWLTSALTSATDHDGFLRRRMP